MNSTDAPRNNLSWLRLPQQPNLGFNTLCTSNADTMERNSKKHQNRKHREQMLFHFNLHKDIDGYSIIKTFARVRESFPA
jgi:hypothetical protein